MNVSFRRVSVVRLRPVNDYIGQQAAVQVIILNVRSILVAAVGENEKVGVDCCTALGSKRP
jgi:hypothetical protein